MHFLVITLLALESATVVDVQQESRTTLRVQIDDMIYTAEFSCHALKPGSIREGEQILVDVKDGKMTVVRKDGRRATARITRVQRLVVHPNSD